MNEQKPIIIIGRDYLDGSERDLALFMDAQMKQQLAKLEGEDLELREQFDFIVL